MTFIESKHTTWDQHISEFSFAYNTTIHEATRTSPTFLNYGRNPEPPKTMHRELERAAEQQMEEMALTNWQAHVSKLEDFRANSAENTRIAEDWQARYYNAKHPDVIYHEGDKVWVTNRVLSSVAKAIAAKFCSDFIGPFIVTARIGTNSYRLRNEEGVDIGKVAIRDFKPWYDAEQFPPGDTGWAPEAKEKDASYAPSEVAGKEGVDTEAQAEVKSDGKDLPLNPVMAEDPIGIALKKRGRPCGSMKAVPTITNTCLDAYALEAI